MGLNDRAEPNQPEMEFKIGGKLFSNRTVSYTKGFEIPNKMFRFNSFFSIKCIFILGFYCNWFGAKLLQIRKS